MRLSQVLPESAIAFGLGGLDKWGVIGKLTDLLVESGQAKPEWRDAILSGLLERERQCSTGMRTASPSRIRAWTSRSSRPWSRSRSCATASLFDAIDRPADARGRLPDHPQEAEPRPARPRLHRAALRRRTFRAKLPRPPLRRRSWPMIRAKRSDRQLNHPKRVRHGDGPCRTTGPQESGSRQGSRFSIGSPMIRVQPKEGEPLEKTLRRLRKICNNEGVTRPSSATATTRSRASVSAGRARAAEDDPSAAKLGPARPSESRPPRAPEVARTARIACSARCSPIDVERASIGSAMSRPSGRDRSSRRSAPYAAAARAWSSSSRRRGRPRDHVGVEPPRAVAREVDAALREQLDPPRSRASAGCAVVPALATSPPNSSSRSGAIPSARPTARASGARPSGCGRCCPSRRGARGARRRAGSSRGRSSPRGGSARASPRTRRPRSPRRAAPVRRRGSARRGRRARARPPARRARRARPTGWRW